jgi:hypothetical protein
MIDESMMAVELFGGHLIALLVFIVVGLITMVHMWMDNDE